MFRILPGICDGASLRKYKLLKALNYFLKKSPSWMFDRIVNSLRLCFHSLFTLGSILNLEFYTLAKTMMTGILRRI